MQMNKSINRRTFLRTTGLGTAGLLANIGAAPIAAKEPRTNDVADFLEITLQATAFELPLLPGTWTRVWGYKGFVLYGDPASLQTIQGTPRSYPVRLSNRANLQAPPRPARPPYSYLGPIIKVRRGQRVRINFTNNLPERTVMH